MPWLLEDRLKELGGQFMRQSDWAEHVVTDGNLITGQNPASARKVGEAMLAYLKERADLPERRSGGVTMTAGEAGLVKDAAVEKGAGQAMSPSGPPTNAGVCC